MNWFISWITSFFFVKPSSSVEDQTKQEINNKSKSIALALEVISRSEQHISSLKRSIVSSESDIVILKNRIQDAESDELAISWTKRLVKEEQELKNKNELLGQALLSYYKAVDQVESAQLELTSLKNKHQTISIQEELATQRVASSIPVDLIELQIKSATSERMADLDSNVDSEQIYNDEILNKMRQLRN